MNITTKGLLDSLDLEHLGDGRFRGSSLDTGAGVIFGGQLLGQAIIAGLDGDPTMTARTVHMIFARAGSPGVPMDIAVESVHSGRSFASRTVTLRQGDRVCASAVVLCSAAEPDLIRHADPAPVVTPPTARPGGGDADGWELEIVDGVDISDSELVGPPDLDVWTRFPGAPSDPTRSQALLAFATDGFLIGTAMRPHRGVGQDQAHRSLATGVISHTISFYEPVVAEDWHLMSHHSDHAGGGRSHGQAQVFDSEGRLVASFVQDAMIRARSDHERGAL